MANIQYNVGTFKGLLGTAIIYEAKTSGNTKFLTYKSLQSDNTTEKYDFMPRSAALAHMASGNLTLATAVKIDDYAEIAPTGVLDNDKFVIIDNEPTPKLPRLFTNQGLFSLKGNGVAAYEGTDLSSRGGTTDGSGSTVVINGAGKTLSESLSEAATWATKNWYIVAIAVILLLELTGITNFLGLTKKKPRLARRRR